MSNDSRGPIPVVMSWSGGKDSALALHELRGDPRYQVVALMTSVSEEFRRISHHGVREELLEAQAEADWRPPDKNLPAVQQYGPLHQRGLRRDHGPGR